MSGVQYVVRLCVALYVIGFVITFGYAWNSNPSKSESIFVTDAELNFVDTLPCAAFWPVYLSVKAFERKGGAK